MATPTLSVLLLSIFVLLRPFLTVSRLSSFRKGSIKEDVEIKCGRNDSDRSGPVPDVFWINLDKSLGEELTLRGN